MYCTVMHSVHCFRFNSESNAQSLPYAHTHTHTRIILIASVSHPVFGCKLQIFEQMNNKLPSAPGCLVYTNYSSIYVPMCYKSKENNAIPGQSWSQRRITVHNIVSVQIQNFQLKESQQTKIKTAFPPSCNEFCRSSKLRFDTAQSVN